ncbi:MAG: hypothetical protein M1830_007523 [Pleopsidium flavum]|nr:MAG: hypothetical protein M1830_007523 [Pleopsidium flavum]
MQGFNMGRYVPPEYEGTTSANKLAGKNALGNRARKSGQGILTVRFEMPFAIWCTTCPKPTIIGQGVRFNAEKKKVDNYYSTPIFSFRMKHSACGGWIEIRTDPKNTAYVVTEGAKKRDTGEDKVQEGEIRIRTDEERERLQNDAFAALEGKVEDKRQALTNKTRVEELLQLQDKDWDDPYAASKKLRRAFRADRKVRQKNHEVTENLKDRMSLGMDLLEETEEDRKRAGFVEFGEMGGEGAIAKAKAKPLFASPDSKSTLAKKHRVKESRKTKTLEQAEKRRETLRLELSGNTRAATDPFLLGDKAWGSTNGHTGILSAIKRKRADGSISTRVDNEVTNEATISGGTGRTPALVDYDSD